MTPEEIIAMAREAGMEVHERKGQVRIGSAVLTGADSTDQVTRFAALAAAKEREALIVSVRSAIQAGRYHFSDPQKRDVSDRVLMDLLDSIRARGAA